MTIPKYQTIAGQEFLVGSLNKTDLRLRIQRTTVEECKEYASLLEKSGYTQYVAREISAGGCCSYNVNLFYTYYKDDVTIFLFWDASIHTVFITADQRSALPSLKKQLITPKDGYMPKVTQLGVAGMSYVIQLCDGSFLCVDGGSESEYAEQELYELLKSNTREGKPKIAMWIFTHAHLDHIQLATDFLARYKDKIEVQAFAYQFADHNKVPLLTEDSKNAQKDIERLEKMIKNGYANAELYTLHTGQSYFFKGAEMEILWSLDNTYPLPYLSLNETSIAFRLKFTNGITFLLLGDCMNEACRQLSHTYGDYLKSDILQVAHHGLIGGDKKLYQDVDPKICFWPVAEERFLGKLSNQRYQWCLGEGGCDYNAFLRDDNVRKRTHYHAGVTKTIEIEN